MDVPPPASERESQRQDRSSRLERLSANRPLVFSAVGGVLAVLLGLALLLATGDSAAYVLITLGIALVALFAPTAGQWEKLGFSFLGLNWWLTLKEKEHGVEFVKASVGASDEVLEAVLPLLRKEATSGVIVLGEGFAGERLDRPALFWLRKELNVSVFAVNRPRDAEGWRGGGQISSLILPAGTKLAVLGGGPEIETARARLGVAASSRRYRSHERGFLAAVRRLRESVHAWGE